ncbi:peptidoglycan-binding domain-containing protein [Planotetraspora mira]|uniref:Peptidoglycan binding-like domain-containing protein n=1 Tax=Planotetraspora mira TaxID=58121 RepID=A0A8J3U0X0_9ACTN|nr:peptidoglycan-binding protein [Planotetraspora mira]GII33989.1 hypothetical protein Pmi06nite_74310 [Planotetraspora mira]
MADQLILLGLGFVLTSVAGGLLTYVFQRRTWAHQHEVEREEREHQRVVELQEQERQRAIKIFEEISTLLDKRLYRMRLVHWAAKRRIRGSAHDGLAAALDGYREVLLDWNDNLNRGIALMEAYFGGDLREQLEELYDHYAAVGRALDQFTRDVGTVPVDDLEVPPLGHRLDRLSAEVYVLNLRMLHLLQQGKLGQSAPGVTSPTAAQPVLQFGDQGPAVRHLQRALHRAEHMPQHIDGLFGRDTEQALCAFQSAHGLTPDGVCGPDTWAELPTGGAMPVLSEGTRGEIVVRLQTALTEYAAERWITTPGLIDKVFGPSTRAAVQAFQRWHGLSERGVVEPHTWAADLGAGDVTLEAEVGLRFVSDGARPWHARSSDPVALGRRPTQR